MKIAQNVTARQFAEVNNLPLARLRVLIKNDRSVRIAFSRKGVNYHDRGLLDLWLVDNKHRFAEKSGYQPRDNGSLFWCARQSHYVPINQRSTKLSLCCVGCERQSKSHQTIVAQRTPKRGDTVSPAVKKHHDDMADMEFKRELSQIDNVDSWMYE